MDPLWSYTITITGNQSQRVASPNPDPGAPAIIAAVQLGLAASGIPPANLSNTEVDVAQVTS